MAAFLAGLVYTLSPFHMAHLLGHMQVMSLQWLPFYVLYLLRAHPPEPGSAATKRPWLRSGLLAGLFLVFNGLCDWYFVLYLLLFTGLAVAWQWGAALRTQGAEGGTAGAAAQRCSCKHCGRQIRPALVAAAVFVALLSFWLVPMVQEATPVSVYGAPTGRPVHPKRQRDGLLCAQPAAHAVAARTASPGSATRSRPISERTICHRLRGPRLCAVLQP